MIPGILEKTAFGVAALALYAKGRLAVPILAAGIIDLIFAALFWVVWRATPDVAPQRADGA
jgi:hypothetical protein